VPIDLKQLLKKFAGRRFDHRGFRNYRRDAILAVRQASFIPAWSQGPMLFAAIPGQSAAVEREGFAFADLVPDAKLRRLSAGGTLHVKPRKLDAMAKSAFEVLLDCVIFELVEGKNVRKDVVAQRQSAGVISSTDT